MNEEEWNNARYPHRMLTLLPSSPRKRRLFAAACCREVWRLICDDRYRSAVEAAEAFADGAISDAARQRIAKSAGLEKPDDALQSPADHAHQAARLAVGNVVHAANAAIYASMSLTIDHMQSEKRLGRLIITIQHYDSRFCELLRDVVNPYFDDAVEPTWRSKNAVALAKTIYRDRSYDMLPILADALMDAGCTSERLLEHCRSQGPHVRGCWAVDVVLGKD
jgi:hypothetical protein